MIRRNCEPGWMSHLLAGISSILMPKYLRSLFTIFSLPPVLRIRVCRPSPGTYLAIQFFLDRTS